MRPDLSVIVPVYNEAKAIRANLDLLIGEVEPYVKSFEVIVVNDGSTDDTASVLEGYRYPNLRIINLVRNRGKGFAVRTGFHEAQGELLLFIDGGMELHPKEIRVFLGLRDLYDADVIVGSKRHPQSKVVYPWYRRFLSFCYQKLMKRLFHLEVTDTQVGIKLFRRAVIDVILPELSVDRYGFDLEMLALARARGFEKMLEAPIRLDYFLDKDRDTVSDLFHVFRVGVDILRDTANVYRRIKRMPIETQDRGPNNTQTPP